LSRVYFTDRSLGKLFPATLTAAGIQVERHHDLFPPNGSDEQWLEYCGTNGRIAITHDQRIRHKINEREAVMRHGVALLIVIGKAPYAELAKHFVATLPTIGAFLDRHKPPFIAKVYRGSPRALARNPTARGIALVSEIGAIRVFQRIGRQARVDLHECLAQAAFQYHVAILRVAAFGGGFAHRDVKRARGDRAPLPR
jgi:hypothetical protein